MLRALFRVRVDGRLEATGGPTLFAANHPAAFDSLLLALLLPRNSVVVLPREDLRSGWLRLALRFVPHLVADMNDPATIKKVMRLLAGGRSVALYPEGRVCDAPSVMKVYEVPALIAAKTGVPVVAIRIRYRPRLAGARAVPGARACPHLRGGSSRFPGAPCPGHPGTAAPDGSGSLRAAASHHPVRSFSRRGARAGPAHPDRRGHEGGAALLPGPAQGFADHRTMAEQVERAGRERRRAAAQLDSDRVHRARAHARSGGCPPCSTTPPARSPCRAPAPPPACARSSPRAPSSSRRG